MPKWTEWFLEQLFPNVEPVNVIAIDNASYHTRKVEKITKTKTKKDNIKIWLKEKMFDFLTA